MPLFSPMFKTTLEVKKLHLDLVFSSFVAMKLENSHHSLCKYYPHMWKLSLESPNLGLEATVWIIKLICFTFKMSKQRPRKGKSPSEPSSHACCLPSLSSQGETIPIPFIFLPPFAPSSFPWFLLAFLDLLAKAKSLARANSSREVWTPENSLHTAVDVLPPQTTLLGQSVRRGSWRWA